MREIVYVSYGDEESGDVAIEYVVLRRMKNKLLLAEAGSGIQRCRMEAGLSQGHMAQKLGISQGAISKMESGHINTPPELILKAVKIRNASAKPQPKKPGAKK